MKPSPTNAAFRGLRVEERVQLVLTEQPGRERDRLQGRVWETCPKADRPILDGYFALIGNACDMAQIIMHALQEKASWLSALTILVKALREVPPTPEGFGDGGEPPPSEPQLVRYGARLDAWIDDRFARSDELDTLLATAVPAALSDWLTVAQALERIRGGLGGIDPLPAELRNDFQNTPAIFVILEAMLRREGVVTPAWAEADQEFVDELLDLYGFGVVQHG